MKKYKRVLSIAGSDSGGGAGIQADIKTISACGCYAMTAITAITSQNTVGVRAIHNIPSETVRSQIEAVAEDIGVDAVKIGMLSSTEIVEAVADALIRLKLNNIVFDPVMVATSGDKLLIDKALDTIKRSLLPIVSIITPNIPEAEILSDVTISTPEDICRAATVISGMTPAAILIKGGHGNGEVLTDTLFADGKIYEFRSERIDTQNTHGTGCSLSSAIASYLAHGMTIPESVKYAIEYIGSAIRSGTEYSTGKGHGPIHHFFSWWK